jgi:hypothetical protein
MTDEKNELDKVENGIDSVIEKMGIGGNIKEADLPDDLVDQMKNSIMPMKPYFKIPLGTEVKNRHNETGYISMCGIDFRGELYLVNFKGDHATWYTFSELKIIEDPCFRISSEDDDGDDETPLKPTPKSDFPEEVDM